MAMVLTVLGYFRKYIERMGEVGCAYCSENDDVTHHLIFKCGRFTEHKRRIFFSLGDVFAEPVVGIILGSENTWNSVLI
ncbi:hypothetical protein J6590_058317 [Homalodisca vitripennis]|nr:hypothetical protein J6590_058317 [Homalodisca vitripennis]